MNTLQVVMEYDFETTQAIDKLEQVLDLYCDKLKVIHEERTREWSDYSAVLADYENDAGKRMLEQKIELIKQRSVPTTVRVFENGELITQRILYL